MIFVTVGTQLPFERLIQAVDDWAGAHPNVPVTAQVGMTEYKPKHLHCVQGLTPQAYQEKLNAANLIVSHVGMGTIISGLSNAKPMILMPRLASLGEHRNDHQVATASKFSHFKLIDIVETPEQLKKAIGQRLDEKQDHTAEDLTVSPSLINALRGFVQGVKNDG